MSQDTLTFSAPHTNADRLGAKRFRQHQPSFTATTKSNTPPPAPAHSYPPQPFPNVLGRAVQGPAHPHHYPPHPLAEATGDGLSAITNPGVVTAPENHPQAATDDTAKGITPLLAPSVLPPSTSPPTPPTEAKVKGESVGNSGPKVPRTTQTQLHKARLVFILCVVVAIASTVYVSSHLVFLPVFGGLQEKLDAFQYVIKGGSGIIQYVTLKVLIWTAFVSPVDCAIPWEGARIVSEWTSPGLGESRPWLYKTMLGLTVVPADAALDPYLPHWSFLGQTGHIALELHRNATIITVIIESDFPDAIPHDIRIWTFTPKFGQDPRRARSPNAPHFPYHLEDKQFSPLLLGDAFFQAGSTPREHRYNVPHGWHVRMPIGVVVLEFLSNGGSDVTRIDRIRILGIPS